MRAALVAALLLTACGGAEEGDSLSVSDARLNPPLGGRDVGAAYMTITNTGEALQLVAAASPDTDVIELHRSSRENGIARMERLDVVDVPRGQTVLEQGGLHLMLFGLTADEVADGVPITLTFSDGRALELVAN